MARIDLNDIRESIKTWDNNALVVTARFKLDQYVPEVQDMIREELRARNLPDNEVGTYVHDEIERQVQSDFRKNYGIQGKLLYFVLQVSALGAGIIIYTIDRWIGNRIDALQVALYATAGFFCCYTAMEIIRKKKKSILLSKLLLCSLVLIFFIIFLINIPRGDALGEFIAFVLNAGNCLIWMNYFSSSKRVAITLTR